MSSNSEAQSVFVSPATANTAVGPDGAPHLSTGPTLSPARKAYVENVTLLLTHKTLIIVVTAIATVLSAVYVFTLPNQYTAQAIMLPARNAGGSLDNIASGISATLKDVGLAKLKGGEESYSPLSLMQSRELKEQVIRQFGLQKVYDAKSMEDAVKAFTENLDGELTEEGNFVVSFTDTSRMRAAAVTNAVVDGINNVNSRLSKEEAQHNVVYAEQRFQQNAADLDTAEKRLGEFQRKYGVFSVTDQGRAEMTALTELETQKYMAEINLRNAEQMYGANSPEAGTYRTTIDQIASKLADMQTGMDTKASAFVPTNVMPDVALDYLRLMREVEIQSKLKAFILPAYEQAKLEENKNLYGFVTLDHAVPPVKKSGPKRTLMVLAMMLGTFAVTSVLVMILTNLKKARTTFTRDQKALA